MRFEPDFSMVVRGRRTSLHIWNTKRPPLTDAVVHAALALMDEARGAGGPLEDDLGVLSAREPVSLHLLRDAPDVAALAGLFVERVEDALRGDDPPPPPPPPEDRPSP